MGLDITKAFRVTDEAVSGRWFDLGEEARVKIAKAGNERHEHVLKRLRRPYRNLRTIPDDIIEKITIRATAETILLDWKGIVEDGKPIQCTLEKRIEYLTKYPDFLETVARIASDHRNFQDEENDSKN